MIFRDAEEDDRERLDRFCCTGAIDGWRKDVEDALRDSLDWARQRPSRHAWVLDDGEDLLAVAAFRSIYAVTPSYGWALEAGGVRIDRQDGKLGQRMLADLLDNLSKLTPGAWVQWFVHRENDRMLHISDNFGAMHQEIEAPPPDHVSRVLRLPDA